MIDTPTNRRMDRIEWLSLAMSFALLLLPSVATAQPTEQPADGPSITQPGQPIAPAYPNPWNRRPECAPMFLAADWQLTGKQRACDWLHNRMFSNGALFGAAWSAEVSKLRDSVSERGDGFGTRFARRYAQSAFKSTAAYVGGLIAHEDPRVAPPYLVLRNTPRPRGFWKRTGHALAYNFVSYQCIRSCSKADDIRRRPALSRVLGAFASGYAAEVWTWDRETSRQRALRGAATAYGSTFVSALVSEFKPELSAFGGKAFGAVFGFR